METRVLKTCTEVTLRALHKTLSRLHLKFANQIWYPHLKKHQMSIENKQHRSTSLVSHLSGMNYWEKLEILSLITLESRRRRGKMIEVFKKF